MDPLPYLHCLSTDFFGLRILALKAKSVAQIVHQLERVRVFSAEHTFQSGGRYRVQLRLKRNRKVLVSTTTVVTVRPGVRDAPYGAQQP